MADAQNAIRIRRVSPGDTQVSASERTASELQAPGPLSGLTADQAHELLRREGPNAVPASARRSLLAASLSVLREPMFGLLVLAAGIYLVLGDVHEALVLGISIVVVLAITVGQEHRTERALDALRDLSSPRALVVRDGVEQRIAGIDVVRGDIVVVSEGDRVPADARLIYAHELQVDESLLTGESMPVRKTVAAGLLIYSGTLVVSGRARAVVVATGARTELGRIGGMLQSISTEKTTLERETARTVKVLGTIALLLCVALAALYYVIRGEALAGVLAGLTLAMAIIPEEFPVVLTVFLAIGAWRIARRGVLTRRMPAVETLGAATVLCVDKTGTLTEGRMAVAEIYTAGSWRTVADARHPADIRVLGSAVLACELEPFDPMDRAILDIAQRIAPEAVAFRRTWRLEKDYGLDPQLLAMCHAWRDTDGALRIALKGAPENVLGICGMSDSDRQAAAAEAARAAERGLRVLGVAEARCDRSKLPEHPSAFSFRWVGFVALADPLRESVPAAVRECRRAGVRVVMITGDYPVTALAIARQAGLSVDAGVVTGRELSGLDDMQLAQLVRRASVFARILPEQKLRLVTAYKSAGEVVAMTGDGVNDAPALRAANIGVAMGKRGTDVAREAAALVLIEDDFGAMVETVRLGRRIYENIRNAMRYLLAVHVPIAGMSFVPLLFGWPLLLFPVHVVFLEFIIDPACSVVFEAEPSEKDSMSKPPRDPREPLFSPEVLVSAIVIGVTALAAVAAAYGWALRAGYGEHEVRATGFAAVVFTNLFLIFAMRSSDRPVFRMLKDSSRALVWVIAGTVAALALALYVPPIAEIFSVSAPGLEQLVVAIAAGAIALITVECLKLLRRTHREVRVTCRGY